MGNSGQLPVWVTLKLEQKQLLVMGEIVLSDVVFSMGRIEPLDIGKCHPGYLALRDDDPGNTFFLPVAPFKLKPLDNFRLLQVGTVLGLNRDARALRIFEIHQKVAGQYLRGTLITTVGQAKLLGERTVSSTRIGNCSRISVTWGDRSKVRKMASSRSDRRWCKRRVLLPGRRWERPSEDTSLV